ncbi:MAG: hypothetical protein ACRDQH_06610 [Pseudonocardiaceae bacterium]
MGGLRGLLIEQLAQRLDRQVRIGGLSDPRIAESLDAYNTVGHLEMGVNPTCRSCGIVDSCGKGCPAAVIAAGQRVGALDAEICPITTAEKRLLPLMPA